MSAFCVLYSLLPLALLTGIPNDRYVLDDAVVMRAATLLLSGPKGEAQLIADLKSPDLARRLAAAQMLFNANEERFLVPLLRSGDDPVVFRFARDAALRAGSRAVPHLRALAASGSRYAIHVLGSIKGNEEFLRAVALSSKDPAVRVAVVYALYNDVDFVASRLEDRSPAVRDAAIQMLLGGSRAARERLLHHPSVEIRARAAETAQRWTGADLDLWAELAEDPDARVRRYAMLQLGGCAWRWAVPERRILEQAVRAVRQAIIAGPPSVQETAVLAVRSWFLLWDEAKSWWPEPCLRAVRDLLKLSPLRNELIRQMRSPQLRVGYVMDIHAEPASHTFARTGDPHALGFLCDLVESGEDRTAIHALPLLGSSDAWLWIVGFLRRAAGAADFQYPDRSRAAFEACQALLKFEKPGPLDDLTELTADSTINPEAREQILMWAGRLRGEEMARTLMAIVRDQTEAKSVRQTAIMTLSYQPFPFVEAFLHELIGDEDLAPVAEFALQDWRKRFGG